MQLWRRLGPAKAQVAFAAASALAYAVGYPVAIVGRSGFGWVLVMLGGVFLMAFGVATVARLHRGGSQD